MSALCSSSPLSGDEEQRALDLISCYSSSSLPSWAIGFDKQWTIATEVCKFIITILGGKLPPREDNDIMDMAVEVLADEDDNPKPSKRPKYDKPEVALAEMRKRAKSKMELCAMVLSDRETQIRGRMLVAALRPTFKSYQMDIKEQETIDGCIRREAFNASNDWNHELVEIANTVHDTAVLRRLAITVPKALGPSQRGGIMGRRGGGLRRGAPASGGWIGWRRLAAL